MSPTLTLSKVSSFSRGHVPPKPKGFSRCRMCFRKFFAFLVSNVGLCLLVVAYSMGGAVMFAAVEAPFEEKTAAEVNEIRNHTLNNLYKITYKYSNLYNDSWHRDVSTEMEIFQNDLLEKIEKGYEGQAVDRIQWSYPKAFLFSLTVISTIGYGNISPKTALGKILTIIYAIIGIPLMLLYLTNIGDLLAKSFRYVYGKLCSCKQDVKPILVAAGRRCGGIECSGGCVGSAVAGSGNNSGCIIGAEGRTLVSGPGGENYSAINGCGTALLPLNNTWGNTRCSTPNYDLILEPGLELVFDPSDVAQEYEIVSYQKEKVRVPITLCLMIMGSYICGGGLLFSVWEGWGFVDGTYFCFITLSTIGFGDLVPGANLLNSTHAEGKLALCSLYLLAGMALLAMCFKLMQEEVIHKIRLFGRKVGIINDSDNHNFSVDT